MTESEILQGAERRIQENRSAEARLRIVDRAGKPVPSARCRVRLSRHEFKLGANAFCIGRIEDATLQREYEDRFAALLNYATLPFYWGSYEPKKGITEERRLESMADWCAQHRIAAKGHPLVWHEVYPEWAKDMDDATVIDRLRNRVGTIVSHFRGKIDIWDVVNEATVSHRFDNAVGRACASYGASVAVFEALRLAHEANPQATLLYNDFNVSPDFESLAAFLVERNAALHTIGIQSHMHKGVWPVEKLWAVCETYARFNLPLHFTESTVLSGRPKAQDDNDWHKQRTDWPTTPDGEQGQLEYGRQFYSVLFSHPAVEAITWWDFSDLHAWQRAPAGLVRNDMTPKPLYDWLMDSFRRRWSTDLEVVADASGAATARCCFGDHEVVAKTGPGDELRGAFSLSRKGDRTVTVAVG